MAEAAQEHYKKTGQPCNGYGQHNDSGLPDGLRETAAPPVAKGEQQLTALSYAIRARVVCKYLGQLGLVVTALTIVPMAVAFATGDSTGGLRYVVVIGILGGASGLASRLPKPSHVQSNEAMAATALAFVLTPLIMTYPLMSAGAGFVDTLFEAVSGITTTGLSTLPDIAGQPPAFLFARSWMQWYGGLGIVVLSVGLLAGHHVASRRLFEPDATSENIVTTTRTHARRVLLVYLILTGLGLVAMSLTSANPLAAVTHTLSSVSTGGFSTYTDSLAGAAGTGAAWVVTLLSFCGAIALPLYYWTYLRGFKQAFADPELRALFLVCLALVTALFIAFDTRMPAVQALKHAVVMGISAQTTTGYSSLPVDHLSAIVKTLLMGAMLVGGSVGSTAGGIKLLRALIALRVMSLTIRRTAVPAHAVVQSRLGERVLESEDIERAVVLILLYLGLVVLSWLPFVAAGFAPLDALFEVISATATVGLSTGISHAHLHPALKGILCFDMLAGRLEIIALLVLLYPGTWFGKKAESI